MGRPAPPLLAPSATYAAWDGKDAKMIPKARVAVLAFLAATSPTLVVSSLADSAPQVLWRQTPTHRVKVKVAGSQVLGSWRWPRRDAPAKVERWLPDERLEWGMFPQEVRAAYPEGTWSEESAVSLRGVSRALIRLDPERTPRTRVVYLFQEGGGLAAIGAHKSADPDSPELLIVEHRETEARLRQEIGEYASPPRSTLPLAPLDELVELFRKGQGAAESVWIRGDTIVRLDLTSDEDGLPLLTSSLLQVDFYFAAGSSVVGLLAER